MREQGKTRYKPLSKMSLKKEPFNIDNDYRVQK